MNENEDPRIPLIEKSIDLSAPYKKVEDRYYSRFFHAVDDEEDQVVLVHTNRICLVSLAANHPVIKKQKVIKRLNFQVSQNCDRLKNKVTGKGKKGTSTFFMYHFKIFFVQVTNHIS